MKQPLPCDLAEATKARLDQYVALLRIWNTKLNLVARADDRSLWSRHVLDSLQLLTHVPSSVREFIDLGSGAGFPGLVLAIVGGMHVHLIEADHRKAAFLREAARVTNTSANIHACRVEAARLRPASLITARAFAPLPRLLTLAMPLLEAGGVCLFLKGQSVDNELTAAARGWHMSVDRVPSSTDALGCILIIRDIERNERG